jgi:16S rRNA U516 pseudouridylate synthase RsuA-like enzyme
MSVQGSGDQQQGSRRSRQGERELLDDDSQIRFFGRVGDGERRQPPAQNGQRSQYRTQQRPQQRHQQRHQQRRPQHRPKRTPGTTLLKAIVSFQWASRGNALKAIHEGRVTLNNTVVRHPNQFIRLDQDVMAVNGQVLQRKTIKPLTIVFHKPKGLPGSREDGQETLYSFLNNKRSWFTPAGVLPASASGIVVVSNDKRHRNPETSTVARLSQDLWVKVPGAVADVVVQQLAAELHELVAVAQVNTRSTWISFTGTNRALRDLAPALKAHNLEVLAWERRRLGPFSITNINPGVWYQLDDQEIVALDELVESGIDDRTPLSDVWETIAQRIRAAQ